MAKYTKGDVGGKGPGKREPEETVIRYIQTPEEIKNKQLRIAPRKYPNRIITIEGQELIDWLIGIKGDRSNPGCLKYFKYCKENPRNSRGYFVPARWTLTRNYFETSSPARLLIQQINMINLAEWERVHRKNKNQNDFRIDNLYII